MDRTSRTVLTQADGLPREALVVILQLICRRQADMLLQSPNAPPHHDETVHMLIEDCAAKSLLVQRHCVMVRTVIFRIKILSVSAVCRLASLSSAWREAADCSFQGKYFLLYKHIAPSTWHYVSARWITDCLLCIAEEAVRFPCVAAQTS